MLLSNFYHRYRMSRRYLLWVLFSGTTQWWGGTTRIIMNLIKLIHEFLSVPTYRRNQTSDSLNRFKLGVNGVSSVCIESITVRPPLVILSLRFNLFYSFYVIPRKSCQFHSYVLFWNSRSSALFKNRFSACNFSIPYLSWNHFHS